MRPEKMFNLINQVHYTTAGLEVDYAIYTDTYEGKCYLIFQPSNQKQDWKVNFSFPVRPYKRQKRALWYHGGYCKAWKSCNDQIMKEFIFASVNYMPVIIGWSYGGAMAVLAAEDFNFRTGFHPEVYTFGAPKMIYGNATKKTIRGACLFIKNYSHVNDVVPKLPPFPFYCLPEKREIGQEEYKWHRVFEPQKYHTIYGNFSYYL